MCKLVLPSKLQLEDTYLVYLDEVHCIEGVKQEEIFTTLHVLPEFCVIAGSG